MAGLRSEEYVKSVLVAKHGLSEGEASNIAQQVGHHAINAVGFLRQAYAGPVELSYLPLYYAVLSLSKVYILCSSGVEALRDNPRHGASFPPSQLCSPLNHTISIWPNGIFPLFYQVLTGRKPEWEKIDVGTLIHLVPCIESELKFAFGKTPALCALDIYVEELGANSFRLKVEISKRHGVPTLPGSLALLKSSKLTLENSTASKDTFVGEPSEGPELQDASLRLAGNIPRELLYYRPAPFFANMMTSTPSNSDFAVPEEIPLWLLFFWLSNLVRYSPEWLSTLQGTSLWPILLTLRKHAALRFLILFWSFFHQTSFGIKAGTI